VVMSVGAGKLILYACPRARRGEAVHVLYRSLLVLVRGGPRAEPRAHGARICFPYGAPMLGQLGIAIQYWPAHRRKAEAVGQFARREHLHGA
jgi:hypothetical protein